MIDLEVLKPEDILYESDWNGQTITLRYKCTIADRGCTWVICAFVKGVPHLRMYEIKRGLTDLFFTEAEALEDAKVKHEYARQSKWF